MTLFYVGSGLLVILALIFMLWPIISRHFSHSANHTRSNEDVRDSTNVSLYHDHLSDINKSLSSGVISQEQYDELKVELERNLLEDSQSSMLDTPVGEPTKGKSAYIFLAIIVLITAAGVIYSQIGAYDSWQIKIAIDKRTELQRQYFASGDADLKYQVTETNRDLVAKLTGYVERFPENMQMRVLLARTAVSLENYSLAIEHFQAVLVQDPELSQVMSELAQAVFLKANNRVIPVVSALVEQTLKRDPNNTVALGIAGIGAFQSEKYQQAITFWKQAVALQGPSSPNSIALQRGIRTAQERLGIQPEQIDSKSVPENAVQSNGAQSNKAASNPTLTVSVLLADGIDVDPETTVFIYARAWQGAKMPLSIARLQVSQLPTTLTLTNAMSMAPGMNLNSATQVELVARVSASGTPVPQAGDWQATLGPVEVTANNTQPYTLMIADKVLK